ncbi:MAG: hypothetical protein R3E79_51250 [Caldilineaceae bacterium]
MSIAFSRSTGALQADSHRTALISLITAIPLILIWIGWFAFATIAVNAVSEQLAPGRPGEVNATFPTAKGAKIRQGQDALLRLTDEMGQERVIPALVSRVAPDGKGQLTVQLAPAPEYVEYEPLPEMLQGKAEVAIEQITPAVLVLRAAGQLIETPPVSLSPNS